MLYVAVSEDGKVITELSYNPPLNAKEIEVYESNGLAVVRPLRLLQPGFDAKTQREAGFTYEVGPQFVTKVFHVADMAPNEIAQVKKENAIGSRKAVLPTYEEAVELLLRMAVALTDRQTMTEDAKDPRTEVKVTSEDYFAAKAMLAICEAHPTDK